MLIPRPASAQERIDSVKSLRFSRNLLLGIEISAESAGVIVVIAARFFMKPIVFPALLLPVVILAATPQAEISEKVPKALAILDTWQAAEPVKAKKSVHIVYWSPADREPVAGYRVRLDAIMEDIRRFYGKEMVRLGFGPRSINLDKAKDGMINVHLAKGSKPYSAYQRSSGDEIRNDCLPVLREAGLDPEKETILIFCNMANWNPADRSINQNSPYYASGTNRNGTGWQVDSPLLNLAFLDKNEPRVKDGQYGDISVGKYNSYFIGGIAHELGHALGLPHNKARSDEKEAFGTALMGAGNQTYGEQLRSEGKGSFLTLSSALRLASHPIFSGSVKAIETPPKIAMSGVEIKPVAGGFSYSGKVSADPPVYAVVGYMDPAGGGDYDATTCTAVPDSEGNFTLTADSLAPGKVGVFSAVFLQSNGAATSFATGNAQYNYPYAVAKDGSVDLSTALTILKLEPLLSLMKEKSPLAARDEYRRLEKTESDPKILEVARVVAESSGFRPEREPAVQTKDICHLSEASMLTAEVGYGKAKANRLPDENMLLVSGGKLFARGIYAHAPAKHEWNLGGSWKNLTGTAGLPDGARGSCVFVITGDGKELWRSTKLESGEPRDFALSVDGVKNLVFTVEDAGDGANSDWGCWFDPKITR